MRSSSRFVLVTGALVSLMPFVGCSGQDTVGSEPTPGATGGSLTIALISGTGGKGASGFGGASGQSPTAEFNCGNSASTMAQEPADLLLLLDRSGSMTNGISDDEPCDASHGACAERWSTMVQSVRTVLSSAPTSIHWGLKLFSTPGAKAGLGVPSGCVVQPGVDVEVGGDLAEVITTRIAGVTPNYNTPTRAAVDAAVAYLRGVDDGRPKYILLATDGQPNCPSDGDEPTATDLPAALAAIAAAYQAGIKVFVVGVGPSTGNLDDMAIRGGTEAYYPALTPQALATALDSIVGRVASCVYTMGTTPPDTQNLGVYLDKQQIPMSASDGWTLGGKQTVVFNGPTCNRIKAGAYKNVQVLFGCPGSNTLPATIP
jgi:hypothetical protein